jgi:iron complex transport system ATP-binding protein
MFVAQNASVIRDGRALVADVDLALRPGVFTVVIGPNGAGKSTLLKALSGEIPPDRGQVFCHERPLARLSAVELAADRAVLPQSTTLSFPFTALEVVRMGAIANGSLDPTRAARAALVRVGLEGFEARPCRALSGGEQQRVQFARALAQVPLPVEHGRARALFLDEPTSSLDIGHQIGVLEIARDFARRGGAVLAILHDLNLAAEFADHLVVSIMVGSYQSPLATIDGRSSRMSTASAARSDAFRRRPCPSCCRNPGTRRARKPARQVIHSNPQAGIDQSTAKTGTRGEHRHEPEGTKGHFPIVAVVRTGNLPAGRGNRSAVEDAEPGKERAASLRPAAP